MYGILKRSPAGRTSSFGPPRLKDSFELPDRSWAWNDDWSLDNGADSDAEG